MTATTTETYTYTDTDVEEVVQRLFLADLKMIASSTRAKSEKWAADTASDIEVFCKHGLLAFVDVTLFDGPAEVKAVKYTVNPNSGELKSSAPGGVLWPRNLANPDLAVTLGFRTARAAEVASNLTGLRVAWVPNKRDTSHPSLNASGGRDLVSGGFGFLRKDYSR
jgi:hypothetical protein